MKNMRIVDANIVLRYLLRDNEGLYKKAKEVLEQQEVFIPNEVIAEIIYVLEKVYKVSKGEISTSIDKLCRYENINFINSKTVKESLEYYSTYNLDYVDSLLCAYKTVDGDEIISFDEKLLKTLKKIQDK